MSKVPFRRFITTFLLFNKDIKFIVDKLYSFGYYITDKEVEDHFEKLKKSLAVRLKSEAAIKFCKENNLIYKISDVKMLSEKEIKELHDKKIIKFTNRYEQMFNLKYSN